MYVRIQAQRQSVALLVKTHLYCAIPLTREHN